MSPAAQPAESTTERKKRLARERQRRHREKVRAQQRAATSNPSNRQTQSQQQQQIQHQSTNRDSQPNRVSVNHLGHPNQQKSSIPTPQSIIHQNEQIVQPQSSPPSQPNDNRNHTQHISHLHSTTPEKTLSHYNTSPPASLPQAQQQQQQQQHLLHTQQQSKPQHMQFTSQSLLLHPHATSFPTTSHPFGNPTNQVQPQQLPPSHPQQEPTFPFSSPHDPSVTHQYVSDPHRHYPQDAINVNPRQLMNRIQAPRLKSRSSQSIPQNQDPAAGLTALPNSLNTIHGGLTPSPSPTPMQTGVPPVSSHMTTLNLNRAPPPSHSPYTRSASVTQRNSSQQRSTETHPGRTISAPESTNAPPPSEETNIERKRRLARERQRRRRKRLKADSEVVTASEVPNTVSNTRQNTNDVQREQGGSQLDVQFSVRGSDTINTQPQALPPQFDSGNLASSNAFASSLQPLQVAAASHPPEDIMNGPSGRNAFNTHPLNMTGAISNGAQNRNSMPGSSVGISQNGANELSRYQANTVDRVPAQQQPENPEQRKRRLARERQRRRRSRLRNKKEGVEPTEVGERETNNTPNRIMENTEPREHNDMRRRDLVTVTETAQEANRAPMTTPSGVFARTDVGQPLSFDQGRQVRPGMPDGMGFIGGNSIQLPQVPVVSSPPNQGLMPWDSIFDSENSAKNAVHRAVEGFLQRIADMRPDMRAYVLQHGIHMLSQYNVNPQEDHRGMMMGGPVMNMRPEPSRHQYVIPNVSTE